MAHYKVEICGINTSKLPLLSNEEKKTLFDKIKKGDKKAYLQIQIRISVIYDFIYLELIETQQPVSLIEAVLAYQRRLFQSRQALVVRIHRDISGIIDAPHRRTLIKSR